MSEQNVISSSRINYHLIVTVLLVIATCTVLIFSLPNQASYALLSTWMIGLFLSRSFKWKGLGFAVLLLLATPLVLHWFQLTPLSLSIGTATASLVVSLALTVLYSEEEPVLLQITSDKADPTLPAPFHAEHPLDQQLILQRENDHLREQLAEFERQCRMVQGQLNQLKQQFDEKKSLLANARTQLFHAEEELERVRREAAESAEERNNNLIHIFEQFLPNFEAERQKMIKAYEDEIEQLHDLISSLMKKEHT